MKFVDEFFERRWIRLDPSTNGRRKFWQTITNVWQTPHARLRSKITVNIFSIFLNFFRLMVIHWINYVAMI